MVAGAGINWDKLGDVRISSGLSRASGASTFMTELGDVEGAGRMVGGDGGIFDGRSSRAAQTGAIRGTHPNDGDGDGIHPRRNTTPAGKSHLSETSALVPVPVNPNQSCPTKLT